MPDFDVTPVVTGIDIAIAAPAVDVTPAVTGVDITAAAPAIDATPQPASVDLAISMLGGGGDAVTPTGTGFRHVTAGVEDPAAKLVLNDDVSIGAAIAWSKINKTGSAESDITGLVSDLAAKVPYVGATGNVNLGVNALTADRFVANQTSDIMTIPGMSFYPTPASTQSPYVYFSSGEAGGPFSGDTYAQVMTIKSSGFLISTRNKVFGTSPMYAHLHSTSGALSAVFQSIATFSPSGVPTEQGRMALQGTGTIRFGIGHPTNTLLNALGTVESGIVRAVQITTPLLPTLTVNGTPGSTLYGYRVTLLLQDGTETNASFENTVPNGPAVLDGTNNINVIPVNDANAYAFNVYRTTGGPSQGKITSTPQTTFGTGFTDTGYAATTPYPTTNATGALVAAQATISGAINAALFSGPATALKSATTSIDVSAAAAPSAGQLLVATDSTHATWQAAGANMALSNLAAVAINAALVSGIAGALDFGSTTKPWKNIWFAGTSLTPGTNQFQLTGASTGGVRTLTMPDASIVVAGSASALTSGRVSFATAGGLLLDDSNLVWDNVNKRLGIGTTPLAQLTSYDSANLYSGMFCGGGSGGYTNGVALGTISGGMAGAIQGYNVSFTATQNLVLQPTGSKVGIGTMSPGYLLDVMGAIASTTANGAAISTTTSSEALTLNVAGLTTVTAGNLAPANSTIRAILVRVTTTITTAANFTVKVTGGNVFNMIGTATSSLTTLTAGTTYVLVPNLHADQYNASATTLTVTTNVNPGAGALRLTVVSDQFTAPTS